MTMTTTEIENYQSSHANFWECGRQKQLHHRFDNGAMENSDLKEPTFSDATTAPMGRTPRAALLPTFSQDEETEKRDDPAIVALPASSVRSLMDGIMSPFRACVHPPDTPDATEREWIRPHYHDSFLAAASDEQLSFCSSPKHYRGAIPLSQPGKLTTSPTLTPRFDPSPICSVTTDNPASQDILCGRGGSSNPHSGNCNFRRLIAANRAQYSSLTKKQKIQLARRIVDRIHGSGGRFLAKDTASGCWYDVGVSRSVEKTSQALREKGTDSGGPGTASEVAIDGVDSEISAPSVTTEASTRAATAPMLYIPKELKGVYASREPSPTAGMMDPTTAAYHPPQTPTPYAPPPQQQHSSIQRFPKYVLASPVPVVTPPTSTCTSSSVTSSSFMRRQFGGDSTEFPPPHLPAVDSYPDDEPVTPLVSIPCHQHEQQSEQQRPPLSSQQLKSAAIRKFRATRRLREAAAAVDDEPSQQLQASIINNSNRDFSSSIHRLVPRAEDLSSSLRSPSGTLQSRDPSRGFATAVRRGPTAASLVAKTKLLKLSSSSEEAAQRLLKEEKVQVPTSAIGCKEEHLPPMVQQQQQLYVPATTRFNEKELLATTPPRTPTITVLPDYYVVSPSPQPTTKEPTTPILQVITDSNDEDNASVKSKDSWTSLDGLVALSTAAFLQLDD